MSATKAWWTDQLERGRDTIYSTSTTDLDYGAAVIIMAFDEQGQADTKDRVEICQRYKILTEQVGFPPRILFLTQYFCCGDGD